MLKNVRRAVFLGGMVVACLLGPTVVLTAEDQEAKDEAKKEAALEASGDGRAKYEEALKLKRTGKWDEAIQTYEKAIRVDRSILGEDDEGLMTALQKSYETRLASDPENLYLLEGLGYISAVGFSEFDKAIRYYQKVSELSKEQAVKDRTDTLIERLRAQADLAKQMVADSASKSREERIKQWAELEKQDANAAEADKSQKREERLSELYSKRDDIEARLPQMEDEIKALQEDAEHNKRMYLNSNDRTYKRRQDRLEDDMEGKKRDLKKLKDELITINADITKVAGEKTETPKADPGKTPGTPGETGQPPGDPNAVPSSDPNAPVDPAAQPGDPNLPPLQSPDFPPDPNAGGSTPPASPDAPAGGDVPPAADPAPAAGDPVVPGGNP